MDKLPDLARNREYKPFRNSGSMREIDQMEKVIISSKLVYENNNVSTIRQVKERNNLFEITLENTQRKSLRTFLSQRKFYHIVSRNLYV